MNLETLSLYCDVIRSGSFSLGAAAHRISQSAASQAVRQLEDELGAQLIGRKGGETVSRDRQHMSEIGREGGESRRFEQPQEAPAPQY